MTGDQDGPHGGRPGLDRDTLRQRTALLGSFAAQDLISGSLRDLPDVEPDLQDFLLEDCTRVTTPRGRRWRLAPGPRARTLDGLCTRERLLAAVRSAPEVDGDLARSWTERLLERAAPPLAVQSFDELYTALTVVDWFDDAPLARDELIRDGVVFPDSRDIEHALHRARLLQPLRALVEPAFTGRSDELARLSAHLDDQAQTGRPQRRGGDAPGSWLFVHGPGGVGKSTLVARFVLDRLDGPGRPDAGNRSDPPTPTSTPKPSPPPAPNAAPTPMPCLYLTFDRHDLVAERPLTLVAEATRQLGLLYPELAHRTAELERELEITLSADRLTRAEDSHFSPRAAQQRDELTLIDAFAALVTSITGDTVRPWLVALDAFEHVQRSGPVAVQRLADFLTLLHRAHPGLRVLAAGRAPFESAAFTRLPLEGFDSDTARVFLRHELTRDAPAGEDLLDTAADGRIEAIIGVVGTSPLNLKLGAALVRREGAEVLDDRRLHDRLHVRLGAEAVQGVLYRRILDHLDDPDLRRIASPGLVMRTLTPEIIREVLAAPCGLGHVDGVRARTLYDAFRAEATLVDEVPGGDAVVHRSDVRRLMLPLLRSEHRFVVDRIHRTAVRYYALLDTGGDRLASQVEELYHRLSLAQSTRTLDRRWTDAAGPLLESAMEELPARAQVYLAEKLGNSATADLRATADDETWERQALRVGKALLAADNPAEVEELLAERPRRARASLDLTHLSLRSMLAQRRPAQAYELVGRALELAAEFADPGVFIDVALLGARSCEDLGRFDEALNRLGEARRAAERAEMEIRLLSVAAAQLRIHRRAGTAATAAAKALRADTSVRVARLGREVYPRHPLLIRELAAEIGDERPDLVSYTARALGVGGTESADDVLLGSLTGAVLAAPAEDEGAAGPGHGAARRDPDSDSAAGRGTVRGSAFTVSSVGRGYAVGSYLDSNPDGAEPFNRALVDSYRHEVDSPYTADAVVVLPGFGGSTLVDDDTGETVWGTGSRRLLDLVRQAGGMERLAVTAQERKAGSGRLRPAGLLRGPAWVPRVGGLAPYDPLVRGIRSVVLHDDAVLEFAYDWRMSVESSGRRLAEAALLHLTNWRAHTARRAAASRGPLDDGPKLVLIAHSMGGLVAQAALAAHPELTRWTRNVITIGTPFRGVPGILGLFAPPGPRPWRERVANPLGKAARSMPGVHDLLPDMRCVITDEGEVRRLTPSDVVAAGGDYALARAALTTRRVLRAAAGSLPRLHVVVGVSQPTVQSLAVEKGGVRLLRHVPGLRADGTVARDELGRPMLVDDGGDGLVPREYAVPAEAVTCVPVVGQHSSLPTSSTVVDVVRDILTGKPGRGPAGAAGSAGTAGSAHTAGGAGGRTRPDPSEGGAPLAAAFGISAPSEVVAGREWTLTVLGAEAGAVACRLVHVETGEVAARPLLVQVGGQAGTSTARVVVTAPGFYEVVAQTAGRSATALVVVTDSVQDG
ncbi:hypothetical protein [Streptomyces mangrovisoli]|uniref:hypothetical protein n=1 Tax=Streptomyces mangrovisoli TaxID=1428628 RepID=UPI0011602E91|nr:hypothetical protein [Streptomyces mangrovisoli]